MPPKSESIVDIYLTLNTKYRKIYGDLTLVLLESGHFYEIYDVVPPSESPHLKCCLDILGILVTRRDKSKPDSSPYMAGIPTHSIRRHIKMLVMQHHYTVVFYTQTSLVPTVVRQVTKIISPGCNLSEDMHETTDMGQSVLLSLCVDVDQDGECYLHLSQFDVNLGSLYMRGISSDSNELESNNHFTQDRFERLQAYLNTITFHELLIHINVPADHPVFQRNICQYITELKETQQREGKAVHIRHITASYITSKSFQKDFLERQFPKYKSSFCNIWESLEIEKEDSYAIGNLILLLEFIEKHDSRMVHDLRKPETSTSEPTEQKHLICYNDVYTKLNVFHANQNTTNSLFHHLNSTNTKMGERLLHYRLLNVSYDPHTMRHRYALTRTLLESKEAIKRVDELLHSIDLERVYRRFAMGTLQPHEIPKVIKAHSNMIQLFEYLLQLPSEMKDLIAERLDENWWTNARILQQKYHDIFDIEACMVAKIGYYPESIFKDGVSFDLDTSTISYGKLKTEMESIRSTLNACILVTTPVPKTKRKDTKVQVVQLKSSDKDGYFFETSHIRGTRLQQEFKSDKNRLDSIFHSAPFGLKQTNIVVTPATKSTSKIESEIIKQKSDDLINAHERHDTLITKIYTELLQEFHSNYFTNCISPGIDLFAEIDVALSNAKMALKHKYIEPIVEEDTECFVKASTLRHPLIERLVMNQGKTFIPSDIEVSATQSYLLYGVNSVGKSSLLKSIAISIIMAQSGLYVAASSFSFCPFRKMFTRTGNEDNMFIHHSSFVKEMTETREIVKHSDSHSIIIADELCASTEIDSATRIVGCLLYHLSQRKASFLFATHLFSLQEQYYIQNLLYQQKTLHNIHLKVNFENKMLVFDRQISRGLPENREYGVLVADKIINTPSFSKLIKRSSSIFQTTEAESDNHVPSHSRYNSKVWLKQCAICFYSPKSETDMPLDTHHIKAQCTSDNSGYIDHIHKNEEHNLVVLCKQCHQKAHSGKLEIEGYQETLNGRQLLWHNNVEK